MSPVGFVISGLIGGLVVAVLGWCADLLERHTERKAQTFTATQLDAANRMLATLSHENGALRLTLADQSAYCARLEEFVLEVRQAYEVWEFASANPRDLLDSRPPVARLLDAIGRLQWQEFAAIRQGKLQS
jgi:hypothetical protein